MDKYFLKIYNGKIIHDGKEKDLCINCVTAQTLKEIKRLKKFALDNYPDKRIVVKEKTKKGWVEIKI